MQIDGTVIASHALDEALKIARERGAELQPLFAIDLPSAAPGALHFMSTSSMNS
jgi:hypothetical protein